MAGVEPVAVALGSNLGDRRRHLQFALERLSALLSGVRVAAVHETAPFDVPAPQPPYLNTVAVGQTTLQPDELLAQLMLIERACGRERPAHRAARTLDLDLILFGNRVLTTPGLTVPHPRFRERRFVLEPLAQLAPDWKDPVTGKRIAELLRELRTESSKGPKVQKSPRS